MEEDETGSRSQKRKKYKPKRKIEKANSTKGNRQQRINLYRVVALYTMLDESKT